MKKLFISALFASVGSLTLVASPSFAKLNDRQAMSCIDSDKLTSSAFQDLQAAYEMRLLSTKDFLQVMEKPANCPQLRKDLKKLHQTALAQLPQPKGPVARSRGLGTSRPSATADSTPTFNNNTHAAPTANPGYNPGGNFNDNYESFPAPPPMPDSDFDEDFSDFR